MAGHKKKAQTEGRTIVFIDESGINTRPHRVRTWSPRGQTPILEFNFRCWKTLSAIAGITFWTFYFQLVKGTVRSPQVIEFLTYLLRHIGRPLIVVWDRLSAHRSHLVREFIAAQQGRIHVEFLPAYAPELNPTEYIWGHWKQHELPNVCPKGWWDLDERSRRTLRRMRRRPRLVQSFWKQAELSF